MTTLFYTRLPFAEAIEFFRGKVNADTDRWDDIWRDEHDAMFIVAGAKGAILQDFRKAVDKAIAEGMSRADFLKEFDRIVATRGWDYKGGRDWRANLIYTTNLRTAYAAGRYQQQTDPQMQQARPYLMWQHGDTRRPRPLHQALDGKILRVNDPFWGKMYPPIGFGCQCSVVSLSERDLKRMGKDGPDAIPLGSVIDAIDPKTGAVTVARVEADPGWDYAPGASSKEKRRQAVLQRLDPALQQQIMAEVLASQLESPPVDTISQKRRQYDTAGDEYEKHFFDEQTGGYVLIHRGHNRQESFESELFVAEAFARQGAVVELVDEQQGEDGVRQFDALVDAEAWEFKELTEKAKNIQNAFQRGLVRGRLQAPRIAYHINREVDVNDLNIGLDRAMQIDKKTRRILRVALIYGDSRVQVLEREGIDAGQKF